MAFHRHRSLVQKYFEDRKVSLPLFDLKARRQADLLGILM